MVVEVFGSGGKKSPSIIHFTNQSSSHAPQVIGSAVGLLGENTSSLDARSEGVFFPFRVTNARLIFGCICTT
ncbi:hypothetical protein F444_08542 [Phytophthora nicotianae P1976]|uniref:Uncharacterized protein n=1 Tax=Phytophthora nicotianae P1976 TaxID=1317066 RepID=A0A081AAR9_PHYNI|nr:hypothetical protein F444_08542 [Phytophthora nicotianae P1976]